MILQFFLLFMSFSLVSMEAPLKKLTKERGSLTKSDSDLMSHPISPKEILHKIAGIVHSKNELPEVPSDTELCCFKPDGKQSIRTTSVDHLKLPQGEKGRKLTKLSRQNKKETTSDDAINYGTPDSEKLRSTLASKSDGIWHTKRLKDDRRIARYESEDRIIYFEHLPLSTAQCCKNKPAYGSENYTYTAWSHIDGIKLSTYIESTQAEKEYNRLKLDFQSA